MLLDSAGATPSMYGVGYPGIAYNMTDMSYDVSKIKEKKEKDVCK